MSPPAITEFLKGSETAISFSREDHPPSVVRPGHSALVLDAQIGGYAMSKVFMDGGSGINIIFADTLRKMNRSVENLPKSSNTFHGIVPGKAVSQKALYNSTLRSGTKTTSGQSRLSSKWSTGSHNTMPYLDARRLLDSWQSHITHTSS